MRTGFVKFPLGLCAPSKISERVLSVNLGRFLFSERSDIKIGSSDSSTAFPNDGFTSFGALESSIPSNFGVDFEDWFSNGGLSSVGPSLCPVSFGECANEWRSVSSVTSLIPVLVFGASPSFGNSSSGIEQCLDTSLKERAERPNEASLAGLGDSSR
jgi:hypothetical protein